MKPSLKWLLTVLVLAALGLLTVLTMTRRAATVAAPSPAASATERVLELAPSDVVTVRRVELVRTLEVSGGVKAVNSAVVRAKVAAEVKSLAVREGDAVKAGQIVVTVDTTEFDWRLRQAERYADSTRAQLDIARRALDNNKAMVAQGFISPTALEASVSNAAAAHATLQAALAAVELARKGLADTRLAAPISGLVSQRLVQPGERVAVDAKLLEIVDLSQLEVEAAVAPEDVPQLKIGATASLRVDGLNEALPARVVRINPSAQAGSRSVLVYLAVQPNPALRQGLFARGMVELARASVLAVPSSAVRSNAPEPYVLAIESDRLVRRTVGEPIEGEVDGVAMRSVGDALPEGSRLVAGSVGTLAENARVKVMTLGAKP